MPNLTWHKLKMNWAEVELPEVGTATQAAPTAVQADIPYMLHAIHPADFDAALDAAEGTADWESGMGPDAAEWISSMGASNTIAVCAPAGQTVPEMLVVHVNAEAGAISAVCLDIVAEAGSALHVALHIDSPSQGEGVAASQVRVLAEEGARVHIDAVQTLAPGFVHLDNVGCYIGDRASVTCAQTVLGAGQSYTGFASNLAGYQADCQVDTRYLGHGASAIDFNYVMRQRGKKTTCTLLANGVLMDAAAKVLRGTIDLVHGCKGSVGRESETVLLVNEDVRNKTIPIILCDEDDVQGDHGATIGHVNPEQMRYLQSRGLSAEQVEDLFAVAVFDYAAAHAFDDTARTAVQRLGAQVLGQQYETSREVD